MAKINQENSHRRARALTTNRYPVVGEDPVPHYWMPSNCSYWSITKALGQDVTNQVANPSFERDTTGWYPSTAAVTLVRTQFGITGGYRLSAVPPGGSGSYMVLYAGDSSGAGYPQATVAKNQTMYASVWVRAKSGNTITLSLFFDGIFGGSPPYALEGKKVSYTADGQWQQLSCEFTATPRFATGVNSWELGLKIENDNAVGGNMDIDSAVMTAGVATDYFDGDSGSGITWDGNPHASQSTASRFSRVMGASINFVDLGLDLYSHAGFGYMPVDNIVTSFAQLNGSHYQRTRQLPRTLTMSAVINARCGPTEVHEARKALIDAMSYRFEEICTEELELRYQLRSECCGALSAPVGIRCVYQAGLEGLHTSSAMEKVTLQFIANNDPTFYDIYESNVILSNVNLTGTTVNATGNAGMYPIIELRAGASAVTIERIINDTPQYAIGLGSPTLGYTLAANNYLIINTDPRSFSATQYPAGTNVLNQVNFPASNAVGKSMMLPGSNSWRAEWGATNPGDQVLLLRWRNRFLSADSLFYYGGCSVCCGVN